MALIIALFICSHAIFSYSEIVVDSLLIKNRDFARRVIRSRDRNQRVNFAPHGPDRPWSLRANDAGQMTITQLILRGNVNKRHVTSLAHWPSRALKISNRANANVSISQFRRANYRSVPPEHTPKRNYLCINPNIHSITWFQILGHSLLDYRKLANSTITSS